MTDDDIINLVLKHEGGFTNNPNDRGGPTNFGITAADYGRWLNKGAPATADEVKAMDVSVARAIYQKSYVKDPQFDLINDDKLRLILVDSGVLHGVKRATIWLQLSLGMAQPNGRIGTEELAALSNHKDPGKLPRLVLAHRFQAIAEIVKNKPTQIVFLLGWINRAVTLLDYV
jgi:lysozyme family protein